MTTLPKKVTWDAGLLSLQAGEALFTIARHLTFIPTLRHFYLFFGFNSKYRKL